MLFVVTYSKVARQSLRNICNRHPDVVVRRFGRAALLEETEFGAFHALRLRARHGGDVQVDRTVPFNEYRAVRQAVRDAARAYERRDSDSTPYRSFAANTDHPDPDELRDRALSTSTDARALEREW